MRRATFHAVRQQFGFRCAYCGVSEIDTGTTLTTDHFQPRSHGGTDDFANLVYACHACNEHKGDYWNPNGIERILHPLNDNTTEHFVLDENDTLEALTPTGAFHLQRLQLNRAPLVYVRRRIRQQRLEQSERTEVLALLMQMNTSLAELNRAVRERRAGGECRQNRADLIAQVDPPGFVCIVVLQTTARRGTIDHFFLRVFTVV